MNFVSFPQIIIFFALGAANSLFHQLESAELAPKWKQCRGLCAGSYKARYGFPYLCPGMGGQNFGRYAPPRGYPMIYDLVS